jgi:hydrogenase expression/formation protein HypE
MKHISLAHGGGGQQTHDFLKKEIVSRFFQGNTLALTDSASLTLPSPEVVMSTDSFVVSPWRFPGGNIGHLAVCGTANDVACSGAKPLALSLSLILEEGLLLDDLRVILDTIATCARQQNLRILTGDTKVVPKGQCDQIYVNTTGIGTPYGSFAPDLTKVQPGDRVLVSGTLGEHGMAVMSAREQMDFIQGPESDCAPIFPLLEAMAPFAPDVRWLRDPTRGGLAAVLNELSEDCPFGIHLNEASLPFGPKARAMSEILGIDLLHVACEGRLVAVVAPQVSEGILHAWRTSGRAPDACCVGETRTTHRGVVMTTLMGSQRVVDLPMGELLPRIC